MTDADFDSLLADLEGSVKIDDPITAEAAFTVKEPEWNTIMNVPTPPPPPSPGRVPSSPGRPPSSSPSASPRKFNASPTVEKKNFSQPKFNSKPISKPPPKSGGKTVFYRIEGDREHKVQSVVKLYLTAKDAEDYAVPVDTSKIHARLDGPEKTKGSVSEVDIGRYQLTFQPGTIGEHLVLVDIDGTPLFDNPLRIRIVESFTKGVETLNFSMEGKGLKGGKVGEPVSFTIHVESSKGPKQIQSSDLRVIVGSGPTRFDASVSQISPGRYKASYTAKVAGKYSVDVLYQDKSVLSAPGQATFSAPADASRSGIVGAPSHVPQYSNAFFTIQAKNNLGLACKIGGDPFNVEVSGPAEAQDLTVNDHNDGTYTVKFMLPASGKYTFHVKLFGQEISGSPVHINV
eukprot:TRINITY_DN3464_c0_g1_i1.p1 TRINITY_DN3464_c0_g1~~TRINITY_DN3464_c0_g1_i1.p1  ORF type:complete len:402 (+),score=88.63 TRINITY_DN3464_c0_g1_i1:60-1265(+)